MKKNRMNRIIGLVLALVLIIGNLGQVRDPTVVYAEKVGQNEQNVSDNSVPSAEDSGKDTTGTSQEETEAAQDAEAGEDSSEEVQDMDGKDSNQADTDSEDVGSTDVDQADEAEDVVEKSEEVMPLVMTKVGYNLYTGNTLEDANYVGSYATWDTLVAGIKAKGVGTYSIDLYDMDLTPTTNWGTALTSGTDQYFLHFYSSTNNSVTLATGSVMGAHVQFHAGVGLNTPTATGAGATPLTNYGTSAAVTYYNNGTIFANGWKFIVDKGVRVAGYAQLYASGSDTGTGTLAGFDFTKGKTVLSESGKNISAGYIEVNAGQWKTLAGYLGTARGAYRVRVGTDDDKNNPVQVDAVFGKTRSGGYMYPLTPDADIPSEFLQVTGNTIVEYGMAIMPSGSTRYYNIDGTTGSNANPYYTTQKVEVSGSASVLGTLGGVTQTWLDSATASEKSASNRISVSAGSSANDWSHFNDNKATANIIVDILDDAYVAGDVIGNGPNMFFNVHENSKGVHISVKGRAQVGGNLVYGGSSSAGAVVPIQEEPFFTMDLEGTSRDQGVKVGGSVIATDGQDNDSKGSWNVYTKVVNATVNGSIFGYGNLGNQNSRTGMSIKTAKILVKDSTIGGGVYGVATGRGSSPTDSELGSAENVLIEVENSIIGHVAPIFAVSTANESFTASNYYKIGSSNITIKNSVVTGRTVLWIGTQNRTESYNIPMYSFVGEDPNDTSKTTPDVKALATVSATPGGSRSITFNTDQYQGIQLETWRPDVSLTTSMVHTTGAGMKLGTIPISLGSSQTNTKYPGIHKIEISNTDFTRENGNPIVAIIDSGDGTLGTSAEVTLNNCHATTLGKRIEASIFGKLTANVTSDKVAKMALTIKNTNDVEAVGFVNEDSSFYINTAASITLENTVVPELFGKRHSTSALRDIKSTDSQPNRLEFIFKGNNTVEEVLANGADLVFEENSVSYISGKINNTSTTVYDNEWVNVKKNSKVYLGHTGISAKKDILGDAKTQRIFGSIRGTDGEVYIYKDTSDMTNLPNATYPIYVATKGEILSDGMGLGEWTSADGTIVTADKNTELNATAGLNKKYGITEPENSKNSPDVQMEDDVLIAFGTLANAKPSKINDVPLRPWPLVKYKDVNPGITASDERNGWLILGKPRYQVMYKGTGFLEEDRDEVTGLVTFDLMNPGVSSLTSPGDTTYYFTETDPSSIEDIFAVPDNPGYEFLYWELYSTVEEVDENGLLQKDKWIPADEIANTASPPFENKWEAGDHIKLMEFLKEGRLDKSNSKMLMLIPVYKANYVCKIGNKGYLTLGDAFNAINTYKATPETDGSYKIQMLVEEYAIKETCTVEWDKSIQITTASPNDIKLPYLGTEGSRCVLKRQDADTTIILDSFKNAFFNVEGNLSIGDLVLDGNYKEQTPVIENGKVVDYLVAEGSAERIVSDAPLISMTSMASLTLGAESWLINNKTTSTASAIDGNGGNILLENTVVRDNISTSVDGGGILTGGGSNLTLKGKVIVDHNNIDSWDVQEKSNVCLLNLGKIMISGSMTEGSTVGVRVISTDHIDEYVFAEADTELAASDSYQYFSDDYADALDIEINPINKEEIRFVDTVSFAFTKVKAEDTDTALNGAKFDLYRLNCTDGSHNHTDLADLVSQESIDSGCWELVKTDTSGGPGKADGLVDLGALRKGTYMLVESKTVKGYKLPTGQWMIDITPSGAKRLSITAHGPSDDMPPAFMIVTTPEGVVQYKLPNIRLLAVPMSGMPGIQKFLLIGGGLLSVTIMLYILRKRRDDRLGSKN